MSGNSDVAEKADPASPKLLPAPGSSENQATASPRSSSSADQHHSPRSPFLHNLHHRLRKGSIASSSAHSSDAGTNTAPPDPVEKEEAARAARRFLLATIRNDWQWPPPDEQEEHGPLKDEVQKKDELLSSRDAIAWRTREEGPSDVDVDSDGSYNGKRRRKSSDPYRFENPDAIAASVIEKKLKRKRKIEDEMQWNEGLKLWSARRDAWTGAVRTKPPPKSMDDDKLKTNGHIEPPKRRTLSITQIMNKNSNASKLSENSNSTAGEENDGASQRPQSQKTPSSTTHSPSVSSFPHSTSTTASTLDPDPNAPYLPVYPPLFPTSHTLRARIKPPAYPTIYSKVVVQSLTPNVPIPLTHMIGTLVDGWKSEGNWPPQAAAQEAAASFRQKRNSRNEGAFARWRRDQEEKRRLKRVSAGTEAGTHGHGIMKEIIPIDEGDVERKGFRKSLTGAVKKVFGMHEGEEDSDGGLERMGVRFVDEQELDAESEELAGVQGLMKEAKDAMDDNIVLNRGLVEEKA